MAQASRMERKLRRLRNERRLAYNVADAALKEREFLRNAVNELLRATQAKQDDAVVTPTQETL